MALKKLFTPMKIGNCEIPNRMVVPAMAMDYNNYDGSLTEKYMAYHEEKAKGGWGLIITENYCISEHAGGLDRIAGLWCDEQIPQNLEFTNRIHQYDSKIFCQIYHAGRQTCSHVNGGVQPVAPSSIPCPWKREIPKELTIEEIKQIIEDFGDCALRAKKAGFDGIEVHGGHGYLLAEFMSGYSNKRTDEYGGCLANRAKIVKEVITNIRSKVGPDFPVTIRFSTVECKEGGRSIAESRVLARWFEDWGFDGIHASTGTYGTNYQSIVSHMYVDNAWAVDFAAEVKRMVNIPVIAVNRINDPEIADTVLVLDKADFVAMGRASLADPHMPNKAKAGDYESIRYCIGCIQGCVDQGQGPTGAKCLVNPTLGKEFEIDYTKTENPKKVLVIGGGPGGMEAARAAYLKGHHVKLIEKQEALGGQFRSAAYPPCKGSLAFYTNWIIRELKNSTVEICLNTEATKEMIEKEKADVIIMATGGTPIMPPIPGIDKPHVYTAEEILLGKVQPGEIIVVCGGGEVGGETAAHLAIQERKVSLVEMRGSILNELNGTAAIAVNNMLNKYGVTKYLSTKVVAIEDDGVVVSNSTETFKIPADMVVLGLGYVPENKLANELSELCDNVKIIGGAVKTSNALDAIEDGFMAGISIE